MPTTPTFEETEELQETETQTQRETTDGLEEVTEPEGVCAYIVTHKRPKELVRLMASLYTSSLRPHRIIIITQDRDILDNTGFALWRKFLDTEGCLTDVVVLEETDERYAGLAAKKNLALSLMEKGMYEFGITLDDDFVLEPFCTRYLENALRQQPELFAVGPCVRHANNTGLPENSVTTQIAMGTVVNNEWQWGGFRQGVKYARPSKAPLVAEHLAGCFMHRIEAGKRYDVNYDRPVYFMHESDFVYDENVAVVPTAVVHHWPSVSGSLEASRPAHEEDIFENVRYFAEKHGLGSVKSINWTGFKKAI